MKKLFFSFCLIIAIVSTANAQAGSLDNTFGSSGKVMTDFGTTASSFGNAIAIQPDGKILVAGKNYTSATNNDFALVRYNINGTLDNTFDTDGIVTSDFFTANSIANCMAIQADGKILVAGTDYGGNGSYGVARYNSNGTPDISFGTNGKAVACTGVCNSIAMQADGKILLAGTREDYVFQIARLTINGTPDFSFGSSGTEAYSVGPGGTTGSFSFAYSVLVQSDGKIILAGYYYYAPTGGSHRFVVARINSNGTSYDTGFGNGGNSYGDIVDPNMNMGSYNDNAFCAALQSDGKILIAGSANSSSANGDFAVMRLNINGTLDYSFGNTGKTIVNIGNGMEEVRSIAIQSDGKIILAGSTMGTGFDFALVRLNSNGVIDNSFDGDGKVTTNIGAGDDFGCAAAIQTDGKLVLAGRTMSGAKGNLALVRYSGNGTVGIETEEQKLLSFYPNPTTGILIIELADVKETELAVYTINGLKVISKTINDAVATINLNGLSNGVYYLQLKNDNNIEIKKIILNK